jgi:hypothetical protein
MYSLSKLDSFNGMSESNRKSHSLSMINELRNTRKWSEVKPKKNHPTIPEKVRGLTDIQK